MGWRARRTLQTKQFEQTKQFARRTSVEAPSLAHTASGSTHGSIMRCISTPISTSPASAESSASKEQSLGGKGAVQSAPATCGGFVHSVLPGDHHTASFGISAATSALLSIVKSSTRFLKLTWPSMLLAQVHAGWSDTPVLTAPELFASARADRGHAEPPAARHAGSTSTVSTSCRRKGRVTNHEH
jgi:hypothetical protein